MKIGVDLDGVMYRFPEAVLSYCDTIDYWATIGRESPEDREFHFWDDFGRMGITDDEFVRLCIEGVNAGHIFRTGDPLPHAVETVQQLRLDGESIHIITHRWFGDHSEANTVAWLREHGVNYDSIHFIEDKTLVSVDILIDDRDKNYYESWDAGIPCILMTTPSNLDVVVHDPDHRAVDWLDAYEKIQRWGKEGI